MASPEPADIRMRIDLALEAVAEVTARADEVLRAGDDTQAIDEFTRDVNRLFALVGQAVGEVATSLKLLRKGPGRRMGDATQDHVCCVYSFAHG